MSAATTASPPSVDGTFSSSQQQQQQQQPPNAARRLTSSKPSPFLRPSIYPVSPPKFGGSNNSSSLLTSGAALQGNNHSSTANNTNNDSSSALDVHGTGWSPSLGASAQLYGASPMSFGMAGVSFSRPSPLAFGVGGGGGGGPSSGAGGMMLDPSTGSWRGAPGGMGMGSFRMDSAGSIGGFAGYAGGREGILTGTSVRDDPMMDPFLSSSGYEGGYSFTGRNGSYRSSPYANPIALGSFRGGGGNMTMGSLTQAGQSWSKFRAGALRKEAEFCKDFVCCGQDLGNLHDLLEHYEEQHVVVLGGGQHRPGSPDGGNAMMLGSPGAGAGMELSMELDDDVEMDSIDESSPPSSSSVSAGGTSTNVSPVPGHALPGLLPTTSANGRGMSSAMKQLLLDDILDPSASNNGSSAGSSSGSSGKSHSQSPPNNNGRPADSAFDSYVVASPPKIFTGPSAAAPGGRKASLTLSRRAFSGGIDQNNTPKRSDQFASAFGTNVRKTSSQMGFVPEEASSSAAAAGGGSTTPKVKTPSAVAPNILFAGQSGVPAETAAAPAAAAAAAAKPLAAVEPVQAVIEASKSAAADNTQPSLFATHRPYRCPQPGCQKAYKQSNGLKYHLLKGQCNFEVRDAMEYGGLTLEEAEELAKPYLCAAGQGCKKRYRQMNGLKYHYMNSGPHGEIGLMLLTQGTHPNPPNVPTPERKKKTDAAAQAAAQAKTADVRPGGWMRNAVKASGQNLGLPLNDDPSAPKGEDAVLFSGQEGFEL